jgi:hypothetical protein
MVARQRRYATLALAIGLCCLAGLIVTLLSRPNTISNNSSSAHLDYVTGTVVSIEPESHALSIHPDGMSSDAPFSEDPIRFVFRDDEELYESDLGQAVQIGYVHGCVGNEGARDGYCIEFKGLGSPSERDPSLAASHDLASSPVYSCEGKVTSIDSDKALVTLSVESSSPNAQDLGIASGTTCSFDLSAWTMRENLATYDVGDSVDVWFSELTTDDGAYKGWCAQPV